MRATATRFLFFVLSGLCLPFSVLAQVDVFTTSDASFENATSTFLANGWTEVNDNNSKWYVGTAAVAVGSKGAYIDKNTTGGSANSYNNNNALTSHFYRDFTVPAGATNINLTFRWRCAGEAADNLKVFVAPTTVTPAVGVAVSATYQVGTTYFGQGTTFQSVSIPITGAGTTQRLIFSWTQNANNTGANPPAAVDLAQVSYTPAPSCSGTPNAGTISVGTSTFCGSGSTTLTLNGATTLSGMSYQWQYFNGSIWVPVGNSALTYNTGTITTTTQYRVVSTCANSGLSNTSPTATVTINPLPVFTVSPADTFICTTGGSMTLTATGTATSYSWAPATNLNTTTGPTVITTPTAGRSYTVTGTLGSCTATAMAIVSLGTGPVISSTATPPTICSGSSTQLSTSQASGEYEVYAIAPYTLTPANNVVALNNPAAPPTNNNYDDGRTAAISIPFSFTYYGSTYSQIFFGTNGDVAFTQNNLPDYLNQTFPDANNPNNVIALFWHDLDLTSAGTVSYGTVGVAPNRKFVITYSGIPVLGNSTPDNTGQIILHETTNYIDVIVQTSSVSDFKTLGIENSTGTVGLGPTGRNNASWTVSSPEAYRFAIPSYSYAWSPSTNLSGTTIYNPVASGLTSSTSYNVTVKNSVTSCTTTNTVPVTVNSLPTATIAPGVTPICDGQSSTVTFTGTPNATVTYDINFGSPLTVLLDASGNATVTTGILNAAAVYHLQSVVSAQNCTQSITGSATISVKLRPMANITGSTTICNGATAFPTINITQGTLPWTVTYSDGSNTYTQVSSNTSFALTVNPSVTTTYTLTALSDANCTSIPADLTGSATVTVNPRPTATLSLSASAICSGSSADLTVALTGNPPYTFDIYDGTNYTSYANIPVNTYTITVAPGTATTYSVSYLNDANCVGQGSDLGFPVTLNSNVRPTASISGSNTICTGDNTPVTVTLTGSAPWSVSYSDGSNTVTVPGIISSPYVFNVSPAITTTYTLSSVSDANCVSQGVDLSGSAMVFVNATPVLVAQSGNVNTCSGDNAVFAVNATGTGLVYQWKENGIPLTNSGVYSGVNTPILAISDITGLGGNSYQVEITGVCPPVINSAPVTLTENTHNQWSGTVDVNWSNPANWSCGILPTAATDVEITPAAPFQPQVDIPTAICKSLLIYAGASVEIVGTNNALEVKEDIVSLGQFDADAGKVILSGFGPQNVPGVIYKHLEIQGGSIKTFSGNAVVTGMLNLYSGYIQLGQNNLVLGEQFLLNGGGPSSFVITNGIGVVVGENMGLGANMNTVTFPVGANIGSYTPVMIANVGTADDINVRVIDNVWEDYNGNNPIGSPLTADAVAKTWLIHETIPGGSNATITPQWNFADHLLNFNPANCAVSHYIQSDNAWVPGPLNPASGFNPYTQTLSGVASFSPFGVSSAGPLGSELLSFKGVLQNENTQLNWLTTNEVDMKGYDIERSLDKGAIYTKIGSLNATGNGKIGDNNYSYTDVAVTGLGADKLLYRLKLLDRSGKFSYSNVLSVTPGNSIVKGNIDLYPNPVNGAELYLRIGESTNEAMTMQVTDMSGRVLSSVEHTAGSYNPQALKVNVSDLAQGIYMLRIIGANNTTIETLKFNRQ